MEENTHQLCTRCFILLLVSDNANATTHRKEHTHAKEINKEKKEKELVKQQNSVIERHTVEHSVNNLRDATDE
jgi:hypothetical protein